MDSNFFHTLRKLLEKLPGIGPRQANRFLWAMLDFSEDEQKDLARAIAELPLHLKRCTACFRAFTVKEGNSPSACLFCQPNSKRSINKIMVVEKDNDILNIERSGAYAGLYHVLGGMIDPLDENPIVRERIKKLYERIGKPPPTPSLLRRGASELSPPLQGGVGVVEIILALSPTKTGEFTSNYITKVLEPLAPKITRLARGLSTGVELEYADELTLRNALEHRR